jgi:hypothetical protein
MIYCSRSTCPCAIEAPAKGVFDGDLLPGADVKELAAYFDTILRGMAVHARDGASRKQLLAICRVAMQACAFKTFWLEWQNDS